MTKFDRWDKSGPTGFELERVQRNISSTMAGVVEDARRGISKSASMLPPQRDEPPRPASSGTAALTVQGVKYVDAIAESFAERERLEAILEHRDLIRKLGGGAKEPEISDPKANKK